jgi:predicted metal-dependent RNase
MNWIGVAKERIKKVFVVHGEEGAQDAMAGRVEAELNVPSVAPNDAQRFPL